MFDHRHDRQCSDCGAYWICRGCSDHGMDGLCETCSEARDDAAWEAEEVRQAINQ
jgi:hypothetical protein